MYFSIWQWKIRLKFRNSDEKIESRQLSYFINISDRLSEIVSISKPETDSTGNSGFPRPYHVIRRRYNDKK
jgi:hypothetical protein